MRGVRPFPFFRVSKGITKINVKTTWGMGREKDGWGEKKRRWGCLGSHHFSNVRSERMLTIERALKEHRKSISQATEPPRANYIHPWKKVVFFSIGIPSYHVNPTMPKLADSSRLWENSITICKNRLAAFRTSTNDHVKSTRFRGRFQCRNSIRKCKKVISWSSIFASVNVIFHAQNA